jgi:heavy metal translocating P-type ATPase
MSISYPSAGRIVVRGVPFLRAPDGEECRTFVAVLLDVPEVEQIAIATRSGAAEVRFDPRVEPQEFARHLAERLNAGFDGKSLQVPLRPDTEGMVRVHRRGEAVSTWRIVSDLPGRLRVRNDRLFRKRRLCHDIERELMTVMGVERFRSNSLAASVLVHYDPKTIGKAELVTLLDEFLHNAEDHPYLDPNRYELLLCSGAVGLAAGAQWSTAALYPPAAILFLHCVTPTFAGAARTLFVERRLGVDVLDAIVVVMCLVTGHIFAGAVLAWCLAFGRRLLEHAQEDSRRRLANVFAKQPRTAYLYVDGVEVSVPVSRIEAGNLVVVNTGEVIPVDGVVFEGSAIVDQHGLTGESVPVEKEPGSRVYASTLIIGGRILITVEKAGRETTSAKITTILSDTASFRFGAQSRGEMLADQAVIPTIGLAALGYATAGLYSAMAILNCDFGTGIRMAAPLALLSSLSLCATRGILVKDGRALEEMSRIDTIVFDKTGTLTKEHPAVERIHALGERSREEVLTFAAAAERRVGHPIAGAIVAEFLTLGKPFPAVDQSSYSIGYGIAVTVGEHAVRVGSSRYLRQEQIAVTPELETIEERAHDAGHTVVFVAVDGEPAGAIELAPQLRERVAELIADLRAKGVSQVVIISGDHEKPTERLATTLGVDRYFAEVLPEDKARYVELLQKEGRRVCFVGDGINDAIALRRANVSVSIRGATTVATDTAQVVFMDESLARIGEFLDIARALERNVAVSWNMILAPNLACIAGALFLGFGVGASVLANNVAAIAALANGLRPLRLFAHEKRAGWHSERKALPPAKALRRRKRNRLGDLLPKGRPDRKTASVFLGLGVVAAVIPAVPGWPFVLLGTAMMFSPRRRPAPIDTLLQKSIPHRLYTALQAVVTRISSLTTTASPSREGASDRA